MRASIVRIIAVSALTSISGIVLAGDSERRAQVQAVPGPGSGAWRIFDSNDQLVGTLMGSDGVGAVLEGSSFFLQGVSSDGIPNTTSNYTLFYVTADCSGTPYGKPSTSGFFVDHVIIDNALYYVPATASKFTVFSYRLTDQMGTHTCQQLMFPGSSGYSPYSVIPLNFTPPFRVVQ